MSDLDAARRMLDAEKLAFVIFKGGQEIARGAHDGVGELLAAVDRLGADVRGASLADKVVGKAVALVAAHAGIRAVDTPLASQAAVLVLQAHQIALRAETIVAHILNRRGDGVCPLEKLTQPLDEPAAAVAKLREFIAARRMVPPAAKA